MKTKTLIVNLMSLVWMVLAIPLSSYGASGLTYHGRIIKPDGTPLEAANVFFHLQLRSPGSENCLLYDEQQTLNMVGSKGIFVITIGDGTRAAPAVDGGFPIDKVFANRGTLTGLTCNLGTTYSPGFADGRKLQVQFNDGSGWQTLNPSQINYMPLAIEATQISGYKKDQLLRVADGVTATEFSNADWTALWDLITGNSSLYMKNDGSGFAPSVSVDFNGQKIVDLADPTLAQDGATKNYVDTRLGGKAVDVAGVSNVAGDGKVLVWNQTLEKWEAALPTDGSKLPLAGGAMSGAIAMNTFKITDLGDPVAAQDASTKAYSDANLRGQALTTPVGQAGKSIRWNAGNTAWEYFTPLAASDLTNANIVSALGYTPVNRAGDTMTGLLLLSGDPSNAVGAATKQYVDAVSTASSAAYVRIDGTTSLSADWDLNGLTVGGTRKIVGLADPTVADGAATKAYVDTSAAAVGTAANTYADGVAATAESDANTYTDGEIAALDASLQTYADGVAATAESNAKTYADGKLVTKALAVPAVGQDQQSIKWDQTAGAWVYYTPSSSDASKLPLAGGAMSGNIVMGGNSITGLGAPSLGGDAANKTYADANLRGQALATPVGQAGKSIRWNAGDNAWEYFTAGTGNGDALVANPLSQFAATTSAQLAGVLSDETGSGSAVFGTTPTFTDGITVSSLAAGGAAPVTLSSNGNTSSIISLATDHATTNLAGSLYLSTPTKAIVRTTATTNAAIELWGGGSSHTGYRPFKVYTEAHPTIATMVLGHYDQTASAAGRVGKIIAPSGAGTDVSAGHLYLSGGTSTGSGTGGDVRLFTSPAGAAGATVNSPVERMRINSAGNVGIGTTTPTAMLDVNGEIRAAQDGATGFGPYYNNYPVNQIAGMNYLLLTKKAASMGIVGKIYGRRSSGSTHGEWSGEVEFSIATDSGGNPSVTWEANSFLVGVTLVQVTYAGEDWYAIAATATDISKPFDLATFQGRFKGLPGELTWQPTASVSNITAVNSTQFNNLGNRLMISNIGNVGVGVTSATAALQLKAGTAAAGTAPLKLTSGPVMTTPEDGAIEYDGTNFYFTDSGGARRTLATTSTSYNDGSTIKASAGTNAAPSLSFNGDSDTGFYSGAANTIGFSAGGTNIFNMSPSGLVSSTSGGASVSTAAGTAAAPTFSFAGDTDTGWFSPAANTLAAATGGSERVRIDSSGNVGIGGSPNAKLEVASGASNETVRITSTGSGGSSVNLINAYLSSTSFGNAYVKVSRGRNDYESGVRSATDGVAESALTPSWFAGLAPAYGSGSGYNYSITEYNGTTAPRLTVLPGGHVGIGTIAPTYKLDVVGTAKVSTDLTVAGRVLAGTTGFISGDPLQVAGDALIDGNIKNVRRIYNNNHAAYSYLDLPDDPNGFRFYTTNTAKNAGLMRLHIGAAADTANFSIMNSNVGIGTVSPTSKLDIVATQSSTADLFGARSLLTVSPSANQGAAIKNHGINSEVKIPNTTAVNVGSANGGVLTATNEAAAISIDELIGSQNTAINTANATIAKQYGVLAVSSSSSGALTNNRGVFAYSHLSGGTVTDSVGVMAQMDAGGANITNQYGLYVMNNHWAGSITNRYGLYIRNYSGGATNDFGIYADGGAKNYFAGNVGIGVTAPAEKLDVVGNQKLSGNLYMTNDQRIWFGGSNTASITGADSSTASYLNFKTNGNDAMHITAPGNVGIGTTTPNHKLSVLTGVNSTVAIGGTLAIGQYSGIHLGRLNGTDIHNKAAIFFERMGADGEGQLHFALDNTADTSNANLADSRMVITRLGRVGIGLTNPSYQLELSTDSAAKPGTSTWTVTSDVRLKDVQGSFTRGIDAMLGIEPIYFNYKKDNVLGLPSDKTYVGIRAQDVKANVPEAVRTDDKGFMHVTNDAIIWTMFNAIKELYRKWTDDSTEIHRELASVKEKNEKLEQENAAMKASFVKLNERLEALEKSSTKQPQ